MLLSSAQPTGGSIGQDASIESVKIGGDSGLGAGSRSTPCPTVPEAAAQQARKGGPPGREARREAGAVDRKEGTETRGSSGSSIS